MYAKQQLTSMNCERSRLRGRHVCVWHVNKKRYMRRDLDSAVQIAQYMESVMHSLSGRSSRPVQTVVTGGNEVSNVK